MKKGEPIGKAVGTPPISAAFFSLVLLIFGSSLAFLPPWNSEVTKLKQAHDNIGLFWSFKGKLINRLQAKMTLPWLCPAPCSFSCRAKSGRCYPPFLHCKSLNLRQSSHKQRDAQRRTGGLKTELTLFQRSQESSVKAATAKRAADAL